MTANTSTVPTSIVTECYDMNVYFWRTNDSYPASNPNRTDHTQYLSVVMLFSSIYVLLFTFGIILNLRVIISVVMNSMHQTVASSQHRGAQNTLLINLMVADLLLAVTSVPFTPIMIIAKNWYFGSAMCHLVTFCQALSVMITAGSLMAIALDRYMHICDHTIAPLSRRYALLTTAAIWLVSIVVNIPYAQSRFLMDGMNWEPFQFCGEFCIEDWNRTILGETGQKTYGTVIAAIQFLIPSIVITWCYVKILCIVHANMIGGQHHYAGSLNSEQREKAVQKKKRVHYVLIAIVATFLLSWMPLTVANLIKDFVAAASIIWNPLFIYVLTTRQRKSRKSPTLPAQPRQSLPSTNNSLKDQNIKPVGYMGTPLLQKTQLNNEIQNVGPSPAVPLNKKPNKLQEYYSKIQGVPYVEEENDGKFTIPVPSQTNSSTTQDSSLLLKPPPQNQFYGKNSIQKRGKRMKKCADQTANPEATNLLGELQQRELRNNVYELNYMKTTELKIVNGKKDLNGTSV